MPARVLTGSAGLLSERDRSPLLTIAAAIVVTRAASWIAGMRFDTSVLPTYSAYADPRLLEHDYVSTIWWFHAQPPGVNAFIGAVLQLPEALRTPAFVVAYLVATGVLALVAYVLARELRVPPWGSAVATTLFVASPVAVVYENVLLPSIPLATLLVVTFLGLARSARSGDRRWALAGITAASLLAVSATPFNVVWVAALVAGAPLVLSGRRRATLAVVIVPFLLVAGLHVKNSFQFGTQMPASLLGMELAAVVDRGVPPSDRTGSLSVAPFGPPALYENGQTPLTGVAVLDQRVKDSGAINFNHRVYPDVGEHYFYHAVRNMRDSFPDYVRGLAKSARDAADPPTESSVAAPIADELGAYERLGVWLSWLALGAYAIALVAVPVLALRHRAWVPFLASLTVWMFGCGVAMLGHGSPARVVVEPLVYVLAAAGVADLARHRSKANTSATAASTANDGSAAARNLVWP